MALYCCCGAQSSLLRRQHTDQGIKSTMSRRGVLRELAGENSSVSAGTRYIILRTYLNINHAGMHRSVNRHILYMNPRSVDVTVGYSMSAVVMQHCDTRTYAGYLDMCLAVYTNVQHASAEFASDEPNPGTHHHLPPLRRCCGHADFTDSTIVGRRTCRCNTTTIG